MKTTLTIDLYDGTRHLDAVSDVIAQEFGPVAIQMDGFTLSVQVETDKQALELGIQELLKTRGVERVRMS